MKANHPTPAWRSKSSAARLLGINRKTIQRKVRTGQLPEDEAGRVCADRLAALLTADALRGRRGPKLQLRNDGPRPRYEWQGSGFVKTAEHDDPADKLEGEADNALVSKWQGRMVKLNTATLRAIAGQAMTIARHRGRLARLGLKATPDEMLVALRRGQAEGMTANHRLASAAVTSSR
jgi:hypothetical protein